MQITDMKSITEAANKGGGGHEDDDVFRIVYPANDRGVDAPVDLCPGTCRVDPEDCCSALVAELDGERLIDAVCRS